MKATTHPLHEKIQRFPFDFAGASFPFSRRLRVENGWSEDFTRRVLTEYRRFLFLSGVCGHPVTPPDAVDQAWHLHMVYTRSYWDGLCGETLGFPLHHGPTRGGEAESDKFGDWYAKTVESYRTWFGEEPPADIWIPRGERFLRERNRFQRVNLSENWVIPKRLPDFAPSVATVATLGALPFVFGASGADGIYVAVFISLMVVLLVSLAASSGSRSSRQTVRQGGSSSSSGGDGAVIVDAGGSDDGHGHAHGQGHGDSNSDGGSPDGGGSDGGSSGCGGGCGGGGD